MLNCSADKVFFLNCGKNREYASNSIAKPIHPYLSETALSVNFTAPNKQSPSENLVSKSLDYVSYS